MSTTLEIIRSNARGIPTGYNRVIERAAAAVDAAPNRTPREVIEEVMRSEGLSGYMSYAAPVIAALEAQRNVQSIGVEVTAPVAEDTEREQITEKVREVLRSNGIREDEADTVLVESGLIPAPFSRDYAAEYLRHLAQRKGLSGERAEALLVEVGLVDAPVEEPVAETTESNDTDLAGVLASIQSTLQSLAAFARQHGFRG